MHFVTLSLKATTHDTIRHWIHSLILPTDSLVFYAFLSLRSSPLFFFVVHFRRTHPSLIFQHPVIIRSFLDVPVDPARHACIHGSPILPFPPCDYRTLILRLDSALQDDPSALFSRSTSARYFNALHNKKTTATDYSIEYAVYLEARPSSAINETFVSS